MKKPDIDKETKFIEFFALSGNATESARKSGYENNPSQMGYYLKSKLRKEIVSYREDILFDCTGSAILKLQSLINSESDSVSLNACKHILELNGYTPETNLNIKHDNSVLTSKTDQELITELEQLSKSLGLDLTTVKKTH